MNLMKTIATMLAAFAATGISRAQLSAAQVLQLAGRDHGLCVVIGCGDAKSPALAADLAARSKMLVHGIALDDVALARAQKAISVAKVDGLATVEKVPVNPLPYRDNLANIVVVQNAAGFSMDEALRVAAPNAKLLVFKNGKWEVTTKPFPKEMDEWPQEAHGPDGSSVSLDKIVKFPVGFRWHAGLPMNINNPKQDANAWSATRGMALSGGKCFTLSSSVLENLGPTYNSQHGVDQYVTARDAFNGLFLWRKKIGATHYGGLYYPNRAPFAAVEGLVYAADEEGRLVALDANSGVTKLKFDTAYAPGRVLIDQGIVVAATWKDGSRLGGLHGVDRRLMEFAVTDGFVEAFDAKNGKRLWQFDKLATSLRSADGIVFLVHREGADKHEEATYPPKPSAEPLPLRPPQTVVAVDLHNGKQLWETKVTAPNSLDALRVDAAGLGVVAVAHNNGASTTILSAKDGRQLGNVKAHSYAAFYDGALHLGGKKYEPASFKELGTSALRINSTTCTPNIFVNNITVNNRMGGFNVDGKPELYGGTRGACLFASTPAYGEFYTAQNWCACAPAQIPGFIAFGPIAHEPTPQEMEAATTVEHGSGKPVTRHPSLVTSSDWPMYRHDPQRSNATSAAAPKALDVLWQKTVTRAAAGGTIAADWKENLTDALTAPVVADGVVIAAASDRNQLVALDATTGSELWRRSVGGRIDTPPTIHRGLCLVGSHDGYVYAFNRDDGSFVWRLRVAPREERMVSYGKVESPWPVIGTVLVANGIGYASAGRTQGSDGGIVARAFDPATGTVLWSRAIVPTKNGAEYRDMRRNDLMLQTGDAIQLMITRFDAKTGELRKNPTQEHQKFLDGQRKAKLALIKGKKAAPPAEETMTLDEVAPGIGLEGFISGNWARLGNRKYKEMSFGNVIGAQLSWGERLVCFNSLDGQVIHAVHRDRVGPAGTKLDSKATAWMQKLPDGYQATSVILCDGALVIGGGIYKPGETTGKGFVRLLTLDKGETLGERAFDAPLAYNGIAAAGGKLFATLADGSAVCLGAK